MRLLESQEFKVRLLFQLFFCWSTQMMTAMIGDTLPETNNFTIQAPVGADLNLSTHLQAASISSSFQQQQTVFHLRTALAQCSLTSLFKLELVHPTWQGHWFRAWLHLLSDQAMLLACPSGDVNQESLSFFYYFLSIRDTFDHASTAPYFN